jgi:hypothetical protein
MDLKLNPYGHNYGYGKLTPKSGNGILSLLPMRYSLLGVIAATVL